MCDPSECRSLFFMFPAPVNKTDPKVEPERNRKEITLRVRARKPTARRKREKKPNFYSISRAHTRYLLCVFVDNLYRFELPTLFPGVGHSPTQCPRDRQNRNNVGNDLFGPTAVIKISLKTTRVINGVFFFDIFRTTERARYGPRHARVEFSRIPKTGGGMGETQTIILDNVAPVGGAKGAFARLGHIIIFALIDIFGF